jgi:hypothetical protein
MLCKIVIIVKSEVSGGGGEISIPSTVKDGGVSRCILHFKCIRERVVDRGRQRFEGLDVRTLH